MCFKYLNYEVGGQKMNRYVALILGASLWGVIGIFASVLMKYNLISEQIGFFRLFFGCLGLVIYALTKRYRFKLTKKELGFSIIMGLVQCLFNMFYFKAIQHVGVAAAAVLLYTSPIFLALFSKLFYKENIDLRKKYSLLLCFLGCIICVTGGNFNFTNVSLVGLLLGIGSAVVYANIPTIGKGVFKDDNQITVLIYTFLFGAIFMIPFAKLESLVGYMTNIKTLPIIALLGLVTASIPYSLYFYGISKKIELSKVGVLSSIELVVAVILGWSVLGETFSFIKLLGIGLMIASVFVMNVANTSESIKPNYKVGQQKA